MKDNKRIALIIKTEGLEYDDRVRKEILTVQKIFPEIEFKIYAMLPNNAETEGITDYGVPYKSIYIPARDKYPSAKKAALKAWQFYVAIKKDIIGYDAVWVANIDATFFPMLLHHKRILWDLHELPMRFLGNKLVRLLLRYIFSRCKIVLHANSQREKYLESIGVITNPQKHFALRNFPNFEDFDREKDDTFNKFVSWKGDRKCVYLQGLANEGRAAYESVSAVLRFQDLCAVVVGGFDETIRKRLENEYGILLQQNVMFVGKIAQMKIPQYVSQCVTSLIFYKNISPNNYYCEANRFYQAVLLGLPVVVGNNPSMKELVDKYGFGVSLDDDGRSIDMIQEGILNVFRNYQQYQENNKKYRNKLLWNQQDDLINGIITRLFE